MELGVIIGIVLGCLAGICILAALFFFCKGDTARAQQCCDWAKELGNNAVEASG